ncbi:MAG: type II secretion system protein N [Gammaproteobacteria bacterium]|nr:type II secretion system protein N [Gammaproteobacteria bacterium]
MMIALKSSLKLNWRPWRRYVLLGGLAYGFFLLQQTPISLIYPLAKDVIEQQNIRIYGLEGGLWDGSAQRVEYQGRAFENVEWDVHPLALLIGQLSATVSVGNDNMRIHATVNRSLTGSISLDDISGRISANEVMTLAQVPAVKLDGQFKLDMDHLDLSDGRLQSAEGTLVWSHAGMQFPLKLDLGELSIDVETVDAGVRASLGDKGGPLELRGQLLIQPDGAYSFDAQLSAREGVGSSLGRTIGMLGSYNSQGKVDVKSNGKLAELGLGG